MRCLALAAVLTVAAVIPARAQWDRLMLASSPQLLDCAASGSEGVLRFYVFHLGTNGTRGCRFRVHLPDCLNSATLIGATPYHSAVGDALSGITVDYGECVTSDVMVMRVVVLLDVPAEDCCRVYLLPHSESSSRKAEALDCNMNPFEVPANVLIVNSSARSGCFCAACDNITPWAESPFPPDGSSDADLDPALSWDTVDPEHVPTEHAVYFGTDPVPPLVADWYQDYAYDPGPLMPGTTYYWRVGVRFECGAAEAKGPVWQFTARSDVPVEATTWGRIKNL